MVQRIFRPYSVGGYNNLSSSKPKLILEDMIYLIVAGIIAVLVYIFGTKQQQESIINRAKIPAAVIQWETEVRAAAKEFGVPVSIALSVLWVESAGNPQARGSSGERGLMQLKEIAVKDLQLQGFGTFPNWETDPAQNIRAGVAFLALQYRRTGNWYEAVKAYNQGYAGKDQNPGLAADYLNKVRQKEQFFG